MNSVTLSPATSASRTSTSGSLSASCVSISVWMLLICPPFPTKKAGERPLSVLPPLHRKQGESCANDNSTGMDFQAIDAAVTELGGRTVAESEGGLEIECAGPALHIGLRVHRGLRRARGGVAWAGPLAPADLLHRNRSLELVR